MSEDESPIQHVAVPDELNRERADRVLASLTDMSRATVRRLFDAGAVLVDNDPIAARVRLTAGQVLVFSPIPPADLLVPMAADFIVRYEDDDVIVVDKPPRLTVHPSASTTGPTLASGLLFRYPELSGVGQPDRWGIVHRLDRDTSGLLVVARTAAAYEGLTEAIRKRAVRRNYITLTEGLFQTPLGTIDAPVGTDRSRPTRRMVKVGGRSSRTHYQRLDEWQDLEVTLLSVTLETGRTHQIRVHLASIDHPVIGDRVYGRPHRIDPPRVFLHAGRLGFAHPITGEAVDIESPLPDDLAAVLP